MTIREKIDFLNQAKEIRNELIKQSKTIEEVELLKKMREITREVYGDTSNNYILILNELGGTAKYIGEYEIGIQAILEAKDIISKKFGEDTITYATTLLNLTEIYRFKGELEELESLYLKVISIYEKYNMYEKYEYASVCNNLGLYYQDVNKFDKALELHLKSLSILENNEEWKIALATTYNNLAIAYRAVGKIDMSDEAIKKCLELYEKEVGKGHAMYSSAINNLAVSFYNKGELEKALELFGKNSINYIKVKENVEMVKETIEMRNKK